MQKELDDKIWQLYVKYKATENSSSDWQSYRMGYKEAVLQQYKLDARRAATMEKYNKRKGLKND